MTESVKGFTEANRDGYGDDGYDIVLSQDIGAETAPTVEMGEGEPTMSLPETEFTNYHDE